MFDSTDSIQTPELDLIEYQAVKARLPRKTPAPALEIFKRPTYSCPELGRTSQRPGAYDAFDLPSLMGQDRKPRRFRD